jgi:hypothetical protein
VRQQTKLEKTIRDYLTKQGVQALVRVVTANDPFDGARQLIETYGLGPLVPNTIVIGASEDEKNRDRYCHLIADLHQAQRNLVILRENRDRGFGKRQRIDVWWGGMQANGGLMLVLAYLLRTNLEWRNATIYLKLVVSDEAAAQSAQANLENIVQQLRIPAIPKVLIAAGRSFDLILQESSHQADLIFLGMATPDHPDFVHYYEGLQARTSNLPTSILVLAAPGFSFHEVLGQS